MAEGSTDCGWDGLPPELLRRVVSVLLNDWAYFAPDQATDCLRPVRAVCKAWQSIIDADITQLSLTVSSVRPACLAENFPNAAHLDLSRYHHNSQDVLGVLEHMKLRSLVLADPWHPPVSLPTQSLQHLAYLSFLAEGLLVTALASQFCEALVKLKQLEELQLSRLQLSPPGAQMLAQALTELPSLRKLVLTGGAAPTHMPELYVLLNVDMPQLQTLELMRLGVRMLPRSVSRLVGLTRLAFSGEMMRSVQLPDELLHLTNLKVLDISANLAEQLPGCVLQLSGLQELHAGMNRLGIQVHNFAQMGELESLMLASNKLLALHSSVWGLTTLKRLDLGHNNLSDLPSSISSLTGLSYLNVCHNFLTVLPAGLAYLTHLVDLDISLNTDMRELPTGLGALSLLTRLNASHMRLKQLPNDIGGMVSLEHLDMSHNSLHHLAPQLSSLTALTHLEASDNKLHQSTAVPEELVTLTALKVLRLARNRLQSLPEALGAFSGLQVLDCSGNRLTSVPRVVGRCLALQQLLMSSNRLRGLTSGIGNLVRLQLLDLSHNQYRHLPTMTGDLTQLRELLLADNQLEDLPSSCSSLQKVTQLTLHSNRLHVLPPAISRMSGLQTLTLHDNPLLGRDAVVLHLQRQLPSLSIDSHGPLEGAAAPGRLPLPGGYTSPMPNMNFMTGLFSHPLGPWGSPFGAAPAGAAQAAAQQQQQQQYGMGAPVPPAALPAQPGVQAGVGGYAWPGLMGQGMGAQQGANPPHVYDVRTLEAAMAAQLHMQEQQRAQALQQTLQQAAQRQQQARWHQAQQQPGQQPAQEGAGGVGRFVMLRRQDADNVPALLGEGTSGLAQAPGQQQQQPWQPQLDRGGPSAWMPAAAASGQEQTSPADLFTSSNAPLAAVLGLQLGGDRPQAAAAAAAAGSSSMPPAAAAAGETPWASSGSQPGTTLEQHLAGPSTGPGAAVPGTDSPSAPRSDPHSWRLSLGPVGPGRGNRVPTVRRGEEYYRQFPGGDPEVARMIAEFKLDEVEPSSSPAAQRGAMGAIGDSLFGRGPPARALPPAGQQAAAMERQVAGDFSGPSRLHAGRTRLQSELPVEFKGGEIHALAPATVAGEVGIGRWRRQDGGEGDALLTQYVLNRPLARRQPVHSQADAAAAGQAPADDAASTDSQHSSHEDPTATPHTQAAAAAGAASGSGVAPGAAAAAAAAEAEAEAEETPSSAADTECASDTSSEAEGVQTPTVVPGGMGGPSDQPAAAQQLARAGRQFSSAGGSGSSSSGGGAAAAGSNGAGSSGGGASSCGGSSSGGPARHASAPRASRLQSASGAVGPAAAGGGEDVDSGVECFRDPPASDEDCRGPAAAGDSGQAPAAAEGQAGAADEAAAPQAQEGRSAGYFPFNVLQAAWWGNN